MIEPLPKWCDWNPVWENVWDGIAERVMRGIPVSRIVLSFKAWDIYARWLLGQPHIAKVQYGTVSLLTAAGEIAVVPGDVPDDDPRYEG